VKPLPVSFLVVRNNEEAETMFVTMAAIPRGRISGVEILLSLPAASNILQ
jgi:hypothetical protein